MRTTRTNGIAALFDFDGVIADTESCYTSFWKNLGTGHLGIEDFGHVIKGQTLTQIFDKYFPDEEDRRHIDRLLEEFEQDMSYDYIAGAENFLKVLKAAGIPAAIVTSSNGRKMEQVHKARPELRQLVDCIITSEDITKSKPDPECFLKGMELLGATPENTVVFEDSFHGIRAGRDSGAYIVGLATTNPREAIEPLCDMVIGDFTEMTLEKLTGIVKNRKKA